MKTVGEVPETPLRHSSTAHTGPSPRSHGSVSSDNDIFKHRKYDLGGDQLRVRAERDGGLTSSRYMYPATGMFERERPGLVPARRVVWSVWRAIDGLRKISMSLHLASLLLPLARLSISVQAVHVHQLGGTCLPRVGPAVLVLTGTQWYSRVIGLIYRPMIPMLDAAVTKTAMWCGMYQRIFGSFLVSLGLFLSSY